MENEPPLLDAPLVSVAELAAQLDEPRWRIVDCRFDLQQPEAGEAAFAEGHIPGALYAHLERDLSGPVTAATGRHPLPAPQALCATLSDWGIDEDTRVVCYDAQANAYAGRLWWLLRWLGHRRVAVLDGGLRAWEAAGYPLDARPPQARRRAFRGHPREEMVASSTEVAMHFAGGGHRLLDVRAPERFTGQREPIDPVAGHVPGAVNLPFQSDLDSGGRYLPPEALKRMYLRILGGVRPDHCAVMCGSGVTACHSLLALELAGLPGARLYAGSWSEWIRDPGRPVARGG